MKTCRCSFLLGFLLVSWLFSTATVSAQEKVKPRIDPQGIDGSLVIAGGGKLPDAVYENFMTLAGKDKAHLVIIPTASESADKETAEKLLEPWQKLKPASAVILHTRDRKKADDAAFLEPLKKATGVWFNGGNQAKITEAYLGTAVEKELFALLKRGGVIGGTSAGAAVMSKVMIAAGTDPKTAPGFDFLPGAVLDQHFLKRNRKARLQSVLEKNPGLVGFGIDEATALVVRGRRLSVVGDSTVTVSLVEGGGRPARTFELKGREVADLTALRRSAVARSEPPFPPKTPPVPELAKGSLVIVGGGGMPADATKKFIELAGGPEALIVVLPTAGETIPQGMGEGNLFVRAGAKNVQVLRARTLAEVEDEKSLELLRKAKGIWFGGGRQWRFVDCYEGTKAYPLFLECLKRGGVIGGSSAGASIQGDFMCRGNPLGNLDIMADGYERGFAFLPGSAIDQHFAQRKRFADMTSLIKTYPQLLGIGLDEATAIVVQGHVAEVMGRGQAHFYDAKKSVKQGDPDYESVKAGGKYDLKGRKIVPEK